VTASHVVTETEGAEDELTNTVTAIYATGVTGITSVTATDTHTVQLVHPDIQIIKDADVTTAKVGQTVTYTISVTNTGDWALENLAVNDSLMGDITSAFGFETSLAAGATKTAVLPYIVQAEDVNAEMKLINTADVYANPVGLPNDITDEDSAEVTITMNYDTAWAYNADYSLENWDLVKSNNWGWTNKLPAEEGTFEFDLIMGAGGNIPSSGTIVGSVTAVVTADPQNIGAFCVSVTYDLDAGYEMDGLPHIWIGSTPLPTKNNKMTDSPGQFPYDGTETICNVIPDKDGFLYVAFHSVIEY
ncbi:DUF7507 domain-containing protein, partial [Alkalibacter mobilis]|uniref:DUF7507 domain-containing protein n=1 Tax=Alkalibacter mobilis TaxID=2787712 RepID=UPI0018A0C69B